MKNMRDHVRIIESEWPTSEDYLQLLGKYPCLEALWLKIEYPLAKVQLSEVFFLQMNYEHLLIQYNNRLRKLKMSFILIAFFHMKGIPDEPWFESPGSEGQSIKYFPNFKDCHWIRAWKFNFYLECYYYYYFSIIDFTFILLNELFRLGLDSKRLKKKFKREVLNVLKTQLPSLYEFIKNMRERPAYSCGLDYRNRLTHDLPPNELSSGIKVNRTAQKIQITYGVGSYITCSSFIKNALELIELLAETLRQIEISVKNL